MENKKIGNNLKKTNKKSDNIKIPKTKKQ